MSGSFGGFEREGAIGACKFGHSISESTLSFLLGIMLLSFADFDSSFITKIIVWVSPERFLTLLHSILSSHPDISFVAYLMKEKAIRRVKNWPVMHFKLVL